MDTERLDSERLNAEGLDQAELCEALAGGRPDSAAALTLADATLIADPSGALFWPDQQLLVVADLHLEKGSAFAARGVLLPPYDTAATLTRLARLTAHYAPRLVIALGDSFHDGGGPLRMAAADRMTLTALQHRRDWLWISGNHDPDPTVGIGGRFAGAVAIGSLTFRHEPSAQACAGEVAGHLHPLARVARRGRAIRRRCFASDGRRLVMPAFGAFTGGLNVRDDAFAAVFASREFVVHLLGNRRLFALAAKQCLV